MLGSDILVMLGNSSELQFPVNHILRVNNPDTGNNSVPNNNHSVFQYSINEMRYSSLYDKIDFLLDDFA